MLLQLCAKGRVRRETNMALVLISHAIELPRELEHFAARFALAFPDRNARIDIIERVASEWSKAQGGRVRTDRKAHELLVDNLGGLSITDTERLARTAIFDDGALTPSDLKPLIHAKYELLKRDGVLSFEYDTARFADLGGMRRLKRWLEQRRAGFEGVAGLDVPKGVMLLGVQGCGKSVAARATAGVFGVPVGLASNADANDIQETVVYYATAELEGAARGVAQLLPGADVRLSEEFAQVGMQLVAVLGADYAEQSAG